MLSTEGKSTLKSKNYMTSTFTNSFHNYQKKIRHRGEVPSYSTIARHIRASRPRDCISSYNLIREDGAKLIVVWARNPDGSYGHEIVIA